MSKHWDNIYQKLVELYFWRNSEHFSPYSSKDIQKINNIEKGKGCNRKDSMEEIFL